MTDLPMPGVHPSSASGEYPADVRERLLAECQQIIARYPQPRSALLPMLHLVQSEDGYVSPTGIRFCADVLNLTAAEVSAVATFYTQYKARPNGDYTVGVCTNTLCAIMGGDAIFEAVSEHLGVGHDQTTDDGTITLERIECNAACDYAPVVMVNWEFFDNQTPTTTRALCDRLRAGERVTPTRGADFVADFKHTAHVLAGFTDGRADEGVGAGEASLEGLQLARAKGWMAPPSATAKPETKATGGAPQPGEKHSSAQAPADGVRTSDEKGKEA